MGTSSKEVLGLNLSCPGVVYYFPQNYFCDYLRTQTSMLLFFVFPGAPIIFPPCTNGAYPVILIRYKVFYVWITNHVKTTSVPFHSYRWFLLRSSQSNPHKYLENTRNMFWKIPRKISSSGKLCIWIKIFVLISHFFLPISMFDLMMADISLVGDPSLFPCSRNMLWDRDFVKRTFSVESFVSLHERKERIFMKMILLKMQSYLS